MALIIEDGTGVANADSYITLVDAQAFVDARALSVTLTEAQLLQAMDVLNMQPWLGSKSASDNALPWPRSGVYDREQELIASDAIPQDLINAQVWLAYYIQAGYNPGDVGESGVKGVKIDVLEVDYFKNGFNSSTQVDVLQLPNVWTAISHLVQSVGYIGHA